MACVFKNCASLRSIDLTNWDFTKVIAMGGMFWGCNSLESIEFPDAIMFNMTNSNGGSRQLKQQDGTYNGRTYSTYTQNKTVRVGHGFAFNRNDPDGIFKNDDLIVGTKPTDYFREFQSEDTHLSFDRNNLSHMFDGCYVLRSIDVHNFTTHYVKTMAYMFNDCRTLEYIDLRTFDTDSVLDMTHMFADCWSLEKIDIKTETIESITTKFTVPKCTDFSYMFYNCKSMKELVLDCFLTTSGQYYEHMFDGCTAITKIKIDSFNMIQALNISYMFRNCESLKFLDLSQFATRRVNNMGHIFENIGVNVHPCYKVRIFIPQGFLANNVPNDPEKTPFEYPGRLYDNEGVDVYTDVLEKDVNKQYWRNRNKNFRFHWGYQYSNFVNLRDGTPVIQRCFTGKVKHENIVYAPQYAGEYREWKDMDMGIRLKRIESKMHNGVSGSKAISGEVEGDAI
jgi:surface protein